MMRLTQLSITAAALMFVTTMAEAAETPRWGVYVAKGSAALKTQVVDGLEKELSNVGTVVESRKVLKARRQAGLNVPKARELENQYTLGTTAELSHLVIVETEKEETENDSGRKKVEFFARVHVLDVAAKNGLMEEWYPIRGGKLVNENLQAMVSEVGTTLLAAASEPTDGAPAVAAAGVGAAVAATEGAEAASEGEAPAAGGDEAVSADAPASADEGTAEAAADAAAGDPAEAAAVADPAADAGTVEGESAVESETPAEGTEGAVEAEPTEATEVATEPAAGEGVEEIRATDVSEDAAEPAPTGATTAPDDGRLYHRMRRKSGLFGFNLKDTIGWAAVAGGGAMLISGVAIMATREDRTRTFDLGGRSTDVTRENSRAGGAWLTTLGAIAVGGGLALVFINPRGSDNEVAVSPVVTSDGAAFLLSGGF